MASCARLYVLEALQMGLMLCCYEQHHLVCYRSAEPAVPAGIATEAAPAVSLCCATADSSRSTATGEHGPAAECEDSPTSTCQPAAASPARTQQDQQPGRRTAAASARRKPDMRCVDLGALAQSC
jgi:hypothetical protein